MEDGGTKIDRQHQSVDSVSGSNGAQVNSIGGKSRWNQQMSPKSANKKQSSKSTLKWPESAKTL